MKNHSQTLGGQAVLLSELLQIAIEPTLKRQGLSVSAFELLTAIQSFKGKATQAEIAEAMRISAPTLCESVRISVANELVTQTVDAKDRRSKRLELTPKAKRLLQEALADVKKAEQAMLEGIAVEDIDRAVTTITAAIRNLARHASKPETAKLRISRKN